MPRVLHRLLLPCLLLVCGGAGAAETKSESKLSFERMPVNGALTQNSITDMLQDRSGLMWFATLGGVDVYDGYRYRSITSDPRDPDSLSGVLVADLVEDRDGNVWIGGFRPCRGAPAAQQQDQHQNSDAQSRHFGPGGRSKPVIPPAIRSPGVPEGTVA